jgi:hypothetical protein
MSTQLATDNHEQNHTPPEVPSAVSAIPCESLPEESTQPTATRPITDSPPATASNDQTILTVANATEKSAEACP